MKKFLISTTVIVLTTCVLYAQDVKFGIRGGMNMASMATVKSTPASDGYDGRIAPGWGIFTELQYNPTVSFRLGVEYSGLGGKKNGMQAMPWMRVINEIGSEIGMGITEQQLNALGAVAMCLQQSGPYYYSNIENTARFDYVMVPLLAQFGRNVGQTPWRVYVNAGPFVSFILSGKQMAKGTDRMYSDASGTGTLWDYYSQNASPQVQAFVAGEFPKLNEKLDATVTFDETNTTGEMKAANFGVTGNLGIRYQHNRNYFFLEVGGNYGFYTAQDDDMNGSNRLGAFSVMAGYAFSLF